MKTLVPPPRPGALLSFDFDGTLHNPSERPPVPPAFFDLIRDLRTRRNAIWGINTGRSLTQMIEGFSESRFPFLPDWVVTREREIHFPNPYGRWLPHTDWNRRCEKDIRRLFKSARKLLTAIRSDVETRTGAEWIQNNGDPAGIIARTDEEMDQIVQRLQTLTADAPHFGWQRNSIYLRFGHRHYHKGTTLSEIARLHQLGADNTFAIGDSHNDFEMLHPAHAGLIACPANAVAPIKAEVLAHGGFLAPSSHAAGVIEALHHHFSPPPGS